MAPELVPVSDAELERLAREGGPLSIEARIVRELRMQRAMDRQVFAFRVGDYYFTGRHPTLVWRSRSSILQKTSARSELAAATTPQAAGDPPQLCSHTGAGFACASMLVSAGFERRMP